MGRKTKGKLIKLLQLLKDGWTREEIAEKYGVTLRTIYNWEQQAKETLGTATTIETICAACKAGWLRKEPEEEPEVEYQFNGIRDFIIDSEEDEDPFHPDSLTLW